MLNWYIRFGGNVRFDHGKGACTGRVIRTPSSCSRTVLPPRMSSLVPIRLREFIARENVWFEDVCEDAVTMRQTSGTTNITDGGAKGASDKVVQHNGGGVVNIDSFCVRDFGKLYRSCGNCKTQYKRTVNISNVIAKNGQLLAGMNSNYGDVATIKKNQVSSVKFMCDTFRGNDSGKEPTKLTSNKANAKYV